mmetsp:Transcript_15731/g.40243  ORF Transcript_15731/g.40243 Transcript_15731/m.40243 type:complete len:356 (+) Transcript_15731:59-1126(+)
MAETTDLLSFATLHETITRVKGTPTTLRIAFDPTLTDVEVFRFAAALSDNVTLTDVFISFDDCANITDAGYVALVGSLCEPPITTLTLNASQCDNLTEESLHALAGLLPKMKHLTELRCSWNPSDISTEEFDRFLAAVTACRKQVLSKVPSPCSAAFSFASETHCRFSLSKDTILEPPTYLEARETVTFVQLPLRPLGEDGVRYLVPMDGSEFSVWALTKALRYARPDLDVVYLLRVFQHKKDIDEHCFDSPTYTAALKKANVSFGLLVASGDPRYVIVNVVTALNIHHVVMGARGLGKLKRMVLGSVSTYTMHHAPSDVTVVRHWSDLLKSSEKAKIENGHRESDMQVHTSVLV